MGLLFGSRYVRLMLRNNIKGSLEGLNTFADIFRIKLRGQFGRTCHCLSIILKILQLHVESLVLFCCNCSTMLFSRRQVVEVKSNGIVSTRKINRRQLLKSSGG